MAPKFVAPYRLSGKRGKNDAADAQAICEAVTRPSMRFVPVKTVEQQGQLMVHRARQSTAAQQLMQLSGVGETTATAIVSTEDPVSRWARSLAERRGYWRAIVAIAAKNARMCWAVLKHGEGFKMPA
jgi:transposase